MKKGAAFQWEVLVVVIIIVIFGYLFASNLLSEKGQVKTAARSVSDVVQKVPGIGDDEFDRIEVPPPPKEISDAFTKLIETLNIDTNKAPCIADYSVDKNKGLPDMHDYTIEFLPRTEAGPKYIIQLRNPDGRIVDIQYVNPQLCVVAGEVDGKIVAENFYKNWIGKSTTKASQLKPDFKEVSLITISYLSGFTVYNGNIIRVGIKEVDEEADDGDNLEDEGLLYKPSEDKICFFPTKYIGDYGLWGIENDEMSNLRGFVEQKSVPLC